MRPLGSGIWQRWPEFGISLLLLDRNRPDLKLTRFRGDETNASGPDKLVRPAWGGQWKWPWAAIYSEGTFTREPSAPEDDAA